MVYALFPTKNRPVFDVAVHFRFIFCFRPSQSSKVVGLSSADSTTKPDSLKPKGIRRPPNDDTIRVVQVWVALCDNKNQGIVKTNEKLGDGQNPATNLYWGAQFGLKTFFSRQSDWRLVRTDPNPQTHILERCVFQHRKLPLYVVANAYDGKFIGEANDDFLKAASGAKTETIEIEGQPLSIGSQADLLVYVGHNAIMDAPPKQVYQSSDNRIRDVMLFACATTFLYEGLLRQAGAHPVVWTRNLIAPEAYLLAGALDEWGRNQSDSLVCDRVIAEYARYQQIDDLGASLYFLTGWPYDPVLDDLESDFEIELD